MSLSSLCPGVQMSTAVQARKRGLHLISSHPRLCEDCWPPTAVFKSKRGRASRAFPGGIFPSMLVSPSECSFRSREPPRISSSLRPPGLLCSLNPAPPPSCLSRPVQPALFDGNGHLISAAIPFFLRGKESKTARAGEKLICERRKFGGWSPGRASGPRYPPDIRRQSSQESVSCCGKGDRVWWNCREGPKFLRQS